MSLQDQATLVADTAIKLARVYHSSVCREAAECIERAVCQLLKAKSELARAHSIHNKVVD